MENSFNLENLGLTELKHDAAIEISGGDKFMKDLGHAFGYGWMAICDFWSSAGTAQGTNDYM